MCMESVGICGALAESPVSCPTSLAVGSLGGNLKAQRSTAGSRTPMGAPSRHWKPRMEEVHLRMSWQTHCSTSAGLGSTRSLASIPVTSSSPGPKDKKGRREVAPRPERMAGSSLFLRITAPSKTSSGSKVGSSTSQSGVITTPGLQFLRIPCLVLFPWPVGFFFHAV